MVYRMCSPGGSSLYTVRGTTKCPIVRRRTGQIGQFYLGEGLESSLPEFFSIAPEKTAMLTCKITLPYSPHPVIINKNPGFRAFYLDRQNEFRFFHLINAKVVFFSIFGCYSCCPKNLAFARKIMGLPESGGGLQPQPPWLVRLGH